ncbi:MAG: LytTR family DNA-binding domain-containing protein [bacterium]
MNQMENPEVLRAVVIDDERLARKEMVTLLEAHPNIQVVGQADSVESARTEIRKTDPDVLFLDIQMPRKSGFDLLNEIDFDGQIIFVTAYDEYAIRAFEVNALDYLLKPVSPERLDLALKKLNKEKSVPVPAGKKLNYDDCLFLTFGTRLSFLRINQITAITAEKDYTMVSLADGKSGLTGKTMKEWEERLPDRYFSRIHRSTIINIENITHIDKWFNNSLKVHLPGLKEPLVVSRRYARILKERYG